MEQRFFVGYAWKQKNYKIHLNKSKSKQKKNNLKLFYPHNLKLV